VLVCRKKESLKVAFEGLQSKIKKHGYHIIIFVSVFTLAGLLFCDSIRMFISLTVEKVTYGIPKNC